MRSYALNKKSKAFALRIIHLYKYLVEEHKEYVMSKQLLRSGTSIGANVAEGHFSQSEADIKSKFYIALKEAGETQYWLELLHESEYLNEQEFDSINEDATELIKLLTASIKTILS
ncbi:MAG: four helix bundle protein [Bacteroidaceae bacterium]|nr:four helix bundle protein [Bacteroidaceae bacterium]